MPNRKLLRFGNLINLRWRPPNRKYLWIVSQLRYKRNSDIRWKTRILEVISRLSKRHTKCYKSSSVGNMWKVFVHAHNAYRRTQTIWSHKLAGLFSKNIIPIIAQRSYNNDKTGCLWQLRQTAELCYTVASYSNTDIDRQCACFW